MCATKNVNAVASAAAATPSPNPFVDRSNIHHSTNPRQRNTKNWWLLSAKKFIFCSIVKVHLVFNYSLVSKDYKIFMKPERAGG